MMRKHSERFELAQQRIQEIAAQPDPVAPVFAPWFSYMAGQIGVFLREAEYFEQEDMPDHPLEELLAHNRALYEDILPDHYEYSYARPSFAQKKLGKSYGPLFAAITYELRSMIPYLFESEEDLALIRMELFLELHTAFTVAFAQERKAPAARELRNMLYSYVSDYAEDQELYHVRMQLVDTDEGVYSVIMDSDLSCPGYLFSYGEYISENQLGSAAHLWSLPEEKISRMADTFTEGYRVGFENTGKDLSKKHQVEIVYPVGFERMVRRAVHNFEDMGKTVTFSREVETIFRSTGGGRSGWGGEEANPQYRADHSEDLALILDDRLMNRRIEALQSAYRTYADKTRYYAGPAVIETFGEEAFSPAADPARRQFGKKQEKWVAKYRQTASRMYNEAVIGRNRSFTIISFPVPEISSTCYEEIFDAVLEINTLDYRKYQQIQQTLIDTLNQAAYVHVTGRGRNRTDLRVQLCRLEDPSRQTIFENCVADVNIPVGEVFTTPVLKGTEGVLHVTQVYLEGTLFRDLELVFEKGWVRSSTCANFDGQEDAEGRSRALIDENILFHHPSLPMGECAIGTNTTAYAVGKRYNINGKYSILIAEKTGPHFAVGDTCYSDEEDNVVYNPDGKEIVAKDNEASIQRKENPDTAYFGCHTDITIPYDEIALYEAVLADGSSIEIIKDGRFVLPGTEELNVPLEEQEAQPERKEI